MALRAIGREPTPRNIWDDNYITNPFGGLTFVYQVSNDLVSLDAIHRLTINNYSGFSVDASYQIGPPIGGFIQSQDRTGRGHRVTCQGIGHPWAEA